MEKKRRAWSFLVGRIAGIEIRVHLTFLLLVPLFAYGLDPDNPFSGILWLVLLFSCVLAHELAHSLVAQRRGGKVESIVLLPIGGVSKLADLPENWRDELLVSAAGPFMSLALAVVFAFIAVVGNVALWPFDFLDGGMLHRLAWTNLFLAGFNLLPAFPMDGGRVFRALLERKHDRESATRQAASMGRGMAVAMILVGVLLNFWLVVIGVFIYFGASTEEAGTILHLKARSLAVSDVMIFDPAVLDADLRVRELDFLLHHRAQRDFPVVAEDQYLGMLSADTVARADPEERVGALHLDGVPLLGLEDSLEQSLAHLGVEGRRAVPVGDESGQVTGLLLASDVLRAVERLLSPRSDGLLQQRGTGKR